MTNARTHHAALGLECIDCFGRVSRFHDPTNEAVPFPNAEVNTAKRVHESVVAMKTGKNLFEVMSRADSK